jgi:hypothetical protein
LSEIQNGDLGVATDVDNLVGPSIIVENFADYIKVVIDEAKSPRLLPVPINGDISISKSRIDKFGDNKIGGLIRAVGIEETEDVVLQPKLLMVCPTKRLAQVFNDCVGKTRIEWRSQFVLWQFDRFSIDLRGRREEYSFYARVLGCVKDIANAIQIVQDGNGVLHRSENTDYRCVMKYVVKAVRSHYLCYVSVIVGIRFNEGPIISGRWGELTE